MVLYNYDSNTILATGAKGRKGPKLLELYKMLYKQLEAAGIKPVLQQLDNEASESLTAMIMEKRNKILIYRTI